MKFPKSAAIIFVTIAAVVAIVVTVTRVQSTAISKASVNVATGIPAQIPGAMAGSFTAAPGFQATATGITPTSISTSHITSSAHATPTAVSSNSGGVTNGVATYVWLIYPLSLYSRTRFSGHSRRAHCPSLHIQSSNPKLRGRLSKPQTDLLVFSTTKKVLLALVASLTA